MRRGVSIAQYGKNRAFVLYPFGKYEGFGAWMRIPPYVELSGSSAADVAEKALELLPLSGPTGFHIDRRREYEDASETKEMATIKKRLSAAEANRTIAILERHDNRQSMILVIYTYDPKRKTHTARNRIRVKSRSDLAVELAKHFDFSHENATASLSSPEPCGVPFGYKIGWFAVSSANTATEIASSLGMVNLKRADWQTGIEQAYAGKAFISPPLDEWILIPTHALLRSSGASAAKDFKSRLKSISSNLVGEVQLFVTYRVAEFHMWACARRGKLRRAYAYFGERMSVVWEEGKITPSEKKAGVGRIDFIPTEETVMEVASAWSVDPTDLGSREST